MFMKKLWIILLLFLSMSCTQLHSRIPVDISVKSSHDIVRHFLEGFPEREDKWQLTLEVALDYDADRHSRSQAKLSFQSYRFPDGWRIFVLERQLAPSYTLLSFIQGIIFKSPHTHVRFLLARGQEKSAADYICRVMEIWKTEHPQLAAQPQRDYQQLRFFFDGTLAGRFYFILPPELMAPEKFSGAVLNRIVTHYEYRQDGEQRASFHPNIFRAMVHALPTLTPIGVPTDSVSWQVEDSGTIAAIVQTCLQLLPGLASAISSQTEHQFSVTYRCQRDSDGRKSLVADKRQFVNADLGSGFCIRRYQRHCLFAPDGRMLADSLKVTGDGEGGQNLVFSLSLIQDGIAR